MTPEEEHQWLIDNGYIQDDSDRYSEDHNAYVDGSQLIWEDHNYHEWVKIH